MSSGMKTSMTTQYVNERVTDVPLRILNRGPEYIRSRMMNRDSALFQHKRRSAVELLAESRPQYLKSPNSPPEHNQHKTRLGDVEECSSQPASQPSSQDSTPRRPSPCTLEIPPPPPPRDSSYHRGEPEGVERSVTSIQDRVDGQAPPPRPPPPAKPALPPRNKPALPSPDKPAIPPKPTLTKPPVPAKPVISQQRGVTRPSSLPTQLGNQHVSTDQHSANFTQQKRPRYNGTVKAMAMSINCSHSNTDLKRDIPTISTEEWRDNRTDVSSEHDHQSSHSSAKESATIVHRQRHKAISRSRSDLTKRFSSSSDFSELSARFHRNSADLEKFFNEMGLDPATLQPIKLGQSAQAQSSSSLNLFESVSRLGSTDARSLVSGDSNGSDGHLRPHEGGDRTPGGSIVERNARIIKWLCGIKSAATSSSNPETETTKDKPID